MAKKKLPVTFDSPESLIRAACRLKPSQIGEFVALATDVDRTKMLLLCEFFGVGDTPSRWYQLALALAREMYPTPKKSGRRVKWDTWRTKILMAEIERLTIKHDDPAHGVAWAAEQLAKHDPWRSLMAQEKKPAKALEKAYYKFYDECWCRSVREALKDGEMNDDAEWNQLVSDLVKELPPV